MIEGEVGVFLHETTGIDELEDSIDIAQTDDVHSFGISQYLFSHIEKMNSLHSEKITRIKLLQ